MQTIENLQAKHEKELEEAKANLAVAQALPVVPERVLFASKGKPWAAYQAPDIEAALDLLANFKPEPMAYCKGSYLILQPLAWIKQDDQDRAKELWELPEATMLEINGGERYGPNFKLVRFFEYAPGRLVRVSIELAFRAPLPKGSHPSRTPTHYDKRGRPFAWRFVRPEVMAGSDQVVTWSNAHDPKSYHFTALWYELGTFENERQFWTKKEAAQ